MNKKYRIEKFLSEIDKAVGREIRRDIESLLFSLCAIDNTPKADAAKMAENENFVFKIIRDELAGIDGEIIFLPIDTSIASHKTFTPLHYTKTKENPSGLGVDETYKNRGNLLLKIKGNASSKKSRSLAINAHIDTVAPHLPPRIENGVIYARGACDDKASIVTMIKSAQIIDKLRKAGVLRLDGQITFMFVIEEETGGNGSLSLAFNRELRKEYDSVLVLECVNNQIHPANRGAVWYKTIIESSAAPLALLSSYAILEMESEGAAIKGESVHPMFPDRPVQTCHGMIGKFGEHPSRICGHVSFEIEAELEPDDLRQIVESALKEYISVYGDKTKVINPDTGKPKVEKHYAVMRNEDKILIEVFGSTGHMGSILQNDGAITKCAYFIRALYQSRGKNIKSIKISEEESPFGKITMEGGQGFLPTHEIEEIMGRIAEAAKKGIAKCMKEYSIKDNSVKVETSFDKLHNAAFDCGVNSPQMKNALIAAETCGLRTSEDPVKGFPVSCDARVFASEYPGMPVITAGPGKIEYAHSDNEQVRVEDIVSALKFVVLFAAMESAK
jgi:acetylornithine deacetylase/succinyl-diaminopimelate desuccinylase-like protein